MQINGIGVTLLGVGEQDQQNTTTATLWFTFIYLPVFPLARYRVRFQPHVGDGFSYRILATEPRNWCEIARTYGYGWIVIPLLALGPLFLGMTEVWERLRLPTDWQLPYIILGCVWMGIVVWRLAEWQDARCHPQYDVQEKM